MPDELSSIEGLADKHVRALARQEVTDLRGLVQADQRAIYRAMANLRPRPTLEQISRWQDEARSRLGETQQWQTAASFVVVFSRRQAGGAWERRVEAEQTEIEPERHPEVWSGWECQPVCAWMLGQLPGLAPAAPPEPPPRLHPPSRLHPPAAAKPPPARAARAAPGPRVPGPVAHRQRRAHRRGRADRGGDGGRARREPAHRTGRAGPRGLHRRRRPAGNATAGGRPHPAPGRARLEPPGSGGPGRAGQAEFDLAPVPAGDHEMALIAWAPDATAKPVSVTLPRVTIRPEPG